LRKSVFPAQASISSQAVASTGNRSGGSGQSHLKFAGNEGYRLYRLRKVLKSSSVLCQGSTSAVPFKAILLAIAFLFWSANQLWPNLSQATLCNDIAIALFVLGVFLVMIGWPATSQTNPSPKPARRPMQTKIFGVFWFNQSLKRVGRLPHCHLPSGRQIGNDVFRGLLSIFQHLTGVVGIDERISSQ